MKNKGFIAIAFIIIVFLGYYFYKRYRIAPSQILTHLDLVDASNTLFPVENLVGKPLVLTFYASWCSDCLKEMPAMQAAISKELKGLKVYAVTDESIEKLNYFKNNHNYDFIYLKLNKAFKFYDIHAIPTTYIFDKKGNMIYSHVGFIDWTDTAWLEFIRNSTL